jgi:hypothetical protein
VLKDGKVVPALPVVPRPNTLAIREQQLDAKQAERRGLTGPKLETFLIELDNLRSGCSGSADS